MRRLICTCFAIFLLGMTLAASPPARAQSLGIEGMAQCDGWGIMATLTFPEGVYSAALEYSVVLNDLDGVELERHDWTDQIQRFEDPTMMFLFDGPWQQSLDSVYTVDIRFHFLGEDAHLNLDLVCGEPPSEPCHLSYREWCRAPESWPLLEMEIGGRVFSFRELARFHHQLHASHVGGLLRQVVAARLNVAAGCENTIAAEMDRADELLAAVFQGTGRRLARRNREYHDLERILRTFNTQPCDQDLTRTVDSQVMFGEDGDAVQENEITFSGLKAMYR